MGKTKAGCVPVRRSGPENSGPWQFLLVQSRWTPEVWLFPKGSVEEDESPKQAAVRETCEEGGVTGHLGPKLGVWVTNRGSKQKLKMWLLFVTTEHGPESKQWKERKKRLRAWHSFHDARALITGISTDAQRPELLEMLVAAEQVTRTLPNASSASNPSNGARSSSENGTTEEEDTPE